MQALCCHLFHYTHSRDSSVMWSQHVIQDILSPLLGEVDSSLDLNRKRNTQHVSQILVLGKPSVEEHNKESINT